MAVVGAGIAGMGCAWALAKTHQVVLFEKNRRPGGHSRTIDVDEGTQQDYGNGKNKNSQINGSKKKVPVDTGFIVFNKPNYPNLTALFNQLRVPITKSSMSFGVSLAGGKFEYGTGGAGAFFGQILNVFRRRFWAMLFDIIRFNRHAKSSLYDSMTLLQLLDEMKLGEDFRSGYLLPMAASIWSTPKEKMLEYPAKSLLNFFENHGLLTLFNQPQWYTVDGGSREYVDRLLDDYRGEIRLAANITGISRQQDEASIHLSDGTVEQFDRVVLACHADSAISLLNDPEQSEINVLKYFNFQPNRVITHTDTSFMPVRTQCWSSWVYLDGTSEGGQTATGVSLSYWMNNLQPLKTDTPIMVTMNPANDPEPDLVADTWLAEHPVFDQKAIDAQKALCEIQGQNNTFYCGAWTGYGFHEDGLRSGLDVAERLGAKIPWRA